MSLTRRMRNGWGETGYSQWSQKKESKPIFNYDSLHIIGIEAQVRELPRPPTAAEREADFRKHWAHRPKMVHDPFRESASDMRPYITRMLERITERQKREAAEAEAERMRLKAASKGKKGKKK